MLVSVMFAMPVAEFFTPVSQFEICCDNGGGSNNNAEGESSDFDPADDDLMCDIQICGYGTLAELLPQNLQASYFPAISRPGIWQPPEARS